MVNPFADHVLLAYYERIFDWHGYIRFLGLPHLRDNPDVLIQRLFVEPSVSPQHIHPDLAPERWPPCVSSFEAVLANPRLVLLGDPGSGKSTLVSWLAWQFSRPEDSAWTQHFGRLVPLPMVLREVSICAGINWDGLVAAFLTQAVAEPLRSRPDLLASILERGQGFFLIDGLDEIGNVDVRKALCEALRDGFARHPKCRWLITSRVVGYEEAPVAVPVQESAIKPIPLARPSRKQIPITHTEAGEYVGRLSKLREGQDWSFFPLYVAPFSGQQIEAFVGNWYALRESAEAERRQKARRLVAAIAANEGTRRLARIPNLLTLMALIYRVQAKLPHGRALLYDKIAEAYLESIDEFRGLREVSYSLDEKKRWLAYVGFQMQRGRSEGRAKQERSAREILVDQTDLLAWLTEAIASSERGAAETEAEARTFIDYIGRRSGLLLPRGEGWFAFMHLSFQEFFAAWHLADQITAPGGFQQAGVGSGASVRDDLKAWATAPAWRETFVLLFELLAPRSGWSNELADALFGPKFEELSRSDESSRGALVQLAAEASVDPHSGLSRAKRSDAWKACWRWVLANQEPRSPLREGRGLADAGATTRTLTAAEPHDQPLVWQALALAWPSRTSNSLSLDGCTGVADLVPLAGLSDLLHLRLRGCTGVTDLTPLARLTDLVTLELEGCTGVTDLAPLAGLTTLQTLILTNCTGVTDLAPLAGLTALEYLWLDGCTGVTNLAPLAGITALEYLRLDGCTGVTDLAPLARLTGLDFLVLDGCTRVTDLTPLAGLTALKDLFLDGCTGVTDLAPLAGLTKLERLSLDGCTGVTDLAPLAGLESLVELYLAGFTEDQVPFVLRQRKNLAIYGISPASPVEQEHGGAPRRRRKQE